MFTYVLNISWPRRDSLEKIFNGGETYWISGKEKVLRLGVSKGDQANSLLGHKRPVTIDFFQKGATVNSTSYYNLLKQNFTVFIELLTYFQRRVSSNI